MISSDGNNSGWGATYANNKAEAAYLVLAKVNNT